MEHPVNTAFCPLFFAKNGGSFTKRGHPISEEDTRGACDRAFDCASCTLMHEYTSAQSQEGWSVSWECVDCLGVSHRFSEYCLPGFYQAGKLPGILTDDPLYDPDTPQISGCFGCGKQTSFLQLILRR